MGVSINVDLGIKGVGPQVMSKVGSHWENLEKIPVLAQHFIEIVFELNPMEVNGPFGIAIDSL